MISHLRRLNAALGLGVFLALALGACGSLEEPGEEAAATTGAESSALAAATQICHGPFVRGNPKACLFDLQEKEQEATRACAQVSTFYGQNLVVTNEDDHLFCSVWFDCCTPN